MIQALKLFFAVLAPLIVIDGTWLMITGKSFYAKQLGSLFSAHPLWIPIVLFYIMYAIGIAYFIVAPAIAGSLPWYQVLIRGAFLGLLAYGAYDFTNQATIANWPWVVTVVDLAWGTIVTGLSALIAYVILK